MSLERIVPQQRNPYYGPSERDAAIEALEARNENLQRQVTRLLEDRIKVCPDCRERYEVKA